jgi:hypothetical protein
MADDAQSQLLPAGGLLMSQSCRNFADEVTKIPNAP